MFNSARFKLTTWYLLVIMFVSLLFSLFIYKILTNELERGFKRINLRPGKEKIISRVQLTESFLKDTKNRIRLRLIYINITILVLAGAAGYFLAGRTLLPIRVMLDDQTRFIADSSHELRTPLTSLKTSIEVYLRSKKHNLKAADDLIKSLLKEVNSLQVLSDTLISLAQYEKKEINSIAEIVPVDEVIKEACIKIELIAKQKGIILKTRTKKDFIKANYSNIIQLLVIFLDNAIKYSAENKEVIISNKKENNQVIITISDQGIGIAKKDLSHIFDRFYQVELSRNKGYTNGYGLGLSIAKRIVEIYNGSIDVDSVPNKGTTFMIKFPSAAKKLLL